MLSVRREATHSGEFRWVRAGGEVLVTAPAGREQIAAHARDLRRGAGQFVQHVGREGVHQGALPPGMSETVRPDRPSQDEACFGRRWWTSPASVQMMTQLEMCALPAMLPRASCEWPGLDWLSVSTPNPKTSLLPE